LNRRPPVDLNWPEIAVSDALAGDHPQSFFVTSLVWLIPEVDVRLVPRLEIWNDAYLLPDLWSWNSFHIAFRAFDSHVRSEAVRTNACFALYLLSLLEVCGDFLSLTRVAPQVPLHVPVCSLPGLD
jgi:hypothetical protein